MTDIRLNTDTNVQVPKNHSGHMENPDRTKVELSERERHQLYAASILFVGTFLTVLFTVYTRDTLCGLILEGGSFLLAWVAATQTPSTKD